VNFPAGIDRPLSISEIVDRSVTLAVRRWRPLLMLVLIEAIPIGIANIYVPQRLSLAGAVLTIIDVLLFALLAGAVALTTAATEAPSAGAALRMAASRYGAVLAGGLLSSLLVTAAFVVPFGLAAVVTVVVAPIVRHVPYLFLTLGLPLAAIVAPGPYLIGMIVFPIIALEGTSPWSAFRIAFRRASNAGWRRTWGLGLALLALSYGPVAVITGTIDYVIRITKLTGLTLLRDLLADSVSLGFAIVVATVISLEMRVRYEGADLDEVMDQASARAEPSAANGRASSRARVMEAAVPAQRPAAVAGVMTNMPDSAQRGPDPVVNSDRETGTTPPESGAESNDVVGRPAVERPRTAFHEPTETEGEEREPFNEREALAEGGSFDGLLPEETTLSGNADEG